MSAKVQNKGKRKPPSAKWSIHHVPDVPEGTARRIHDLYRQSVNPEQLKASVKALVWNYKIYSKEKPKDLPYVALTAAETARIRLSNLSYLHCEEFSLNIVSVFQVLSKNRILAHKHDLSEMPEKLELARAYVRIASVANTTIRRFEWADKGFVDLVKKYVHNADEVVRSIRDHGVVDERLIEAEIAGVHTALQQGSL